MFDNFLLVAIVIIIMWVGALVYYLKTSSRQGDLQNSIETLREMLDRTDDKESDA
ncbi:MAG: hypothetical protein GY803_18470 [Chloroflexi bacterium]|nr:hypothetical protein [Chloroflexota bacterium]